MAGTLGDPVMVERTFTVQEGTHTSIPMLNAFAVVDTQTSIADIDQYIADFKSNVANVFLEVDGNGPAGPFFLFYRDRLLLTRRNETG